MTKLLPVLLLSIVLIGCSTYSPSVPPLNHRGQNMGDVVTVPTGSSFNPASPGPIGGTTSSTGQFTTLCTGPSPCTLPGTTGDLSVARDNAAGLGNILLGSGSFQAAINSNNDAASNHAVQITPNGAGTFILGNVYFKIRSGLVFANAPACAAAYEGSTMSITDSPTKVLGSTVSVGGGANHVEMYCDGTQWTVAAVSNTGATSFCMGTSASIAAAATDFIACGENPGVTVIGTETNDQTAIPAACTVSNLYVKLTTAANTNTPVITVDKNTTGQTLTCTVANTATVCQDTTHSFTTAVGDLLSLKLVNPASANATGVVYAAYQINC